jgi:lipoprotein NlpD
MGKYNMNLNRRLGLFGLLFAVFLAGCSTKSLNRAPVEDRQTRAGSQVTGADSGAVKLPAGIENAGKPGYYTVKPGDTLIRIGLESGQSPRDIARWSQVEDPNRIEVGQVLRVVPPLVGDVVAKPVARPTVTAVPIATPAEVAVSAPAVSPAKPAIAENGVDWIWPANGVVLTGFDEVKNKGLDIGGAAGDPVIAVADGRVVYVGAGLRGYGNLIILKHDNVYLTAYAHNRTLLVKEDQAVVKGQKIAEMGNSDSDRVKLHFEVRRQGKPVDPAKYLPAR